MKRLFAFIMVVSLLVLGGTLVSANSQTRRSKSMTQSFDEHEQQQYARGWRTSIVETKVN